MDEQGLTIIAMGDVILLKGERIRLLMTPEQAAELRDALAQATAETVQG